ncbi:MAG: DUF4301 family protein [Flavobacteriaceae bacterium]|nr:DUF4301 family protein [Flavobacteriaceae bacterium]
MKLNEKDQELLNKKKISINQFNQQIETFKKGISTVELIRPASINDGILHLTKEAINHYVDVYNATPLEVVKFTPASGAATRMFKKLHQLMSLSEDFEAFEKNLNKKEFKEILQSINSLESLAFYPLVEKVISSEFKVPTLSLSENKKAYYAFQVMLNQNLLNLANLPKGLIYFHNYNEDLKTPFEEHFYEANAYAKKGNEALLHFTVSPKHQGKFEKKFEEIKPHLQKNTQTNFTVEYSYQAESTDTIAVDLDNNPVKIDHQLYFRPGGHGALIENLNTVNASIIFIKNIDNIPHRDGLANNSTYKKALAGVLIEKQNQIFNLIRKLRVQPSNEWIKKAQEFIQNEFKDENYYPNATELIERLNRPIRVCGMVENTGAPGGGPFWMKNGKDEMSLQIVEKAQMNTQDLKQKKIIEMATHFNPVDLVCGVKDVDGNKFDLTNFVNHERGFITEKSVGGMEIKALELPGLWNGAMEYWNTFFVEVPLSTFCPVKSVFDLLHPMHLANS